MRTRKAGRCSTASGRTLQERAGAASTSDSHSPRAMRSRGFFYPTDLFPFTDTEQTDPETGEKGALLEKAIAQKVVPKIFYTNGSYEYWGSSIADPHAGPSTRYPDLCFRGCIARSRLVPAVHSEHEVSVEPERLHVFHARTARRDERLADNRHGAAAVHLPFA